MTRTADRQRINTRSHQAINVEKLLLWRDPHCPDSQLLQEEFSCVSNEIFVPPETQDEQPSH